MTISRMWLGVPLAGGVAVDASGDGAAPATSVVGATVGRAWDTAVAVGAAGAIAAVAAAGVADGGVGPGAGVDAIAQAVKKQTAIRVSRKAARSAARDDTFIFLMVARSWRRVEPETVRRLWQPPMQQPGGAIVHPHVGSRS